MIIIDRVFAFTRLPEGCQLLSDLGATPRENQFGLWEVFSPEGVEVVPQATLLNLAARASAFFCT